MKYLTVIVVFLMKSKLLSAGVTGSPLETSFISTTEDDVEITEVATTEVTTSVGIINVTKEVIGMSESANNSIPDEIPPWSSESSPILKALRDFLFQTRNGLLEASDIVTESSLDDKTEKLLRVIEQGLIEATTLLFNPAEDFTFTLPSVDRVKENSFNVLKIEPLVDSQSEPLSLNVLSIGNKRQGSENAIVNATTACSSCYENLHSCVQKCFTEYNCNDVERNMRTCPPTPSRLCNPFTQWSPVDQCKEHEDCKSPNLCCNDGCINRCSPGVWRS